LKVTECLFQELNKARSIKELLVDSHRNLEKEVRLTDVVQLQIELVTQCFILCLEEHWGITQHFSLNILHLIF